MITLNHYREYRSQFHIVQDFALPSKKALWQDNNLETALIDATEIPIERPKKAKATALR